MNIMDICIPELVCPEDYDCKSAKLEASLSWMLSKAGVNGKSESGICADECSSLLTPSVVKGLTSGLFYYKAMCAIFPKDMQYFDKSHLSIVRWLLRQGFEVLPDEINFEILRKTDPFNQEMHLVLIDKIMAAFIYQTLSVENVVKAIRRFTTFSASSELPSTIEETIVFWSNKVCQLMCEKYQMFLMPESNMESTIEGNNSFYDFLVVAELEDFACGKSLACLLSFYRPDKMVFEDICLDENSGIADSLYNLQLCAEVCSKIFDFPTSSSQAQLLHLTVIDVFYAHVHLTVNLMVLFADLFEYFELSNSYPLPDSNSRWIQKIQSHEPLSIKLPKISDVTKRSFHGIATNEENPKALSSSRTSSLLPLRRDANIREEAYDENLTEFQSTPEHCIIDNVDINENLRQGTCSNSDEETNSTRGTSSINISSSSSREVIGNHFVSSHSGEAFVHRKNSLPRCSGRSYNERDNHNYGHYQAKDQVQMERLKNNNCDSKQQHNDRHMRYCHDLGLISGFSKFRKQGGAGNAKSASSDYIGDNNVKKYERDEVDDEVSAITDVIELIDDEEFITPPEDFDGHRNDLHVREGFNNSNSNTQKYRTGSVAADHRKNLMETSHDARSQSVKTSWLRQKKLACLKDGVDDVMTLSKKEGQRNGTFRVSKELKDEEINAPTKMIKNKELCMTPPQKTCVSLLNQKQLKAHSAKKVHDLHSSTPSSTMIKSSSMFQPKSLKSNLTDGKTTWIHSFSTSDRSAGETNNVVDNSNSPFKNVPSKMGMLKMELIEKRRQIEGKKFSSGVLWSKQRQQVGTEAFIQVVKGHKQNKSEDNLMEKVVEVDCPVSKDSALLYNSDETPNTKAKGMESQHIRDFSDIEKHSNSVVSNMKDNATNSHSNSQSSLQKHISKTEFSENIQNSDEGSPQDTDVNLGFENNIDAVRTIDHLTHSLSELKGEVKRLSLEQDQLKGFVSVSQTPMVNNSKKLKSTQVQQKDYFAPYSKTKACSSPIKLPDSVPCTGLYINPHLGNETQQHKAMAPLEGISVAAKCFSNHKMPYVYSESRPLGVGSPCTNPIYNVYKTPPNNKTHRPLSSDGRYIHISECPVSSSNEFAYMHPNDMGPYPYPLMALPHPFASPQHSQHPNYSFSMREPIRNVNGMHPHPSPIAFTIPNDPSNTMQHNVLPDWLASSYSANFPSNYAENVTPCFGNGLVPLDSNILHYSDHEHHSSNHPQASHFTPIHFRQKSSEITSDPARYHVMAEKSRQPIIKNNSEMTGNHFKGGGYEPPKNKGNDVETTEYKKQSQHSYDDGFLPGEIQNLAVLDNQLTNKSDNNALLSCTENHNEMGNAPDEKKPEESNVEELTTCSSLSDNDEKIKCIIETPVAFVVSQSSDEIVNVDVEKRKQKLEEMHAKRMEDQEIKRIKLERDALMKKELQRQREEHAMQKKTDDRARREAIYQTYLQKKVEGFGEDDIGSRGDQAMTPKTPKASRDNHQAGHHASSTKRQKSARAVRNAGITSNDDKAKDKLPPSAGYICLPLHSQEVQLPQTKESTTSNTSSESQKLNNGDGEKDGQKEYTGPKLFVKPCHKSNRNIIENAISHCCLAGVVNKDTKMKVLEVLKNSESKHFVVLFRDVGMQYRALYTFDFEAETITKIQGVGPKMLTNKHIEKFYKYNSGNKNFSEVTSTKHLSATIDAITLQSAVWQRMKATALAGSKRNLT